jgi:hypothetical protein
LLEIRGFLKKIEEAEFELRVKKGASFIRKNKKLKSPKFSYRSKNTKFNRNLRSSFEVLKKTVDME